MLALVAWPACFACLCAHREEHAWFLSFGLDFQALTRWVTVTIAILDLAVTFASTHLLLARPFPFTLWTLDRWLLAVERCLLEADANMDGIMAMVLVLDLEICGAVTMPD